MSTPGFRDTSAPRVPIKGKPRRQAGHSLRSKLFEERDGFLFYAAGAIMGILSTLGACWWHWWRNPAQPPWWPTITAGLLVVGVIIAGWWRVVALRGVEQGLLGEVTVGAMLERLRGLGYEVLHDVPGEQEGTNIDHVLVGPGGVFVVETKTWSKIGNQQISYDWQRITVDGQDRSRPLAQARACRMDIRRRIEQRLGRTDVHVRAVVVFPGWYVSGAKGRSGPEDVWVLNAEGLEKWLPNEPRRLTPTDVRQLATALAD